MPSIQIKIPENAYDLHIGTNGLTQGLLYKTPDGGAWKGSFVSFGSAGQTPVAGIATRFERVGDTVVVY
jgi:hypothetical protein